MKRYIIILFCLINCKCMHAQHVVLSLEKMNILYIGIDNPIEIAGNNIDCKDVKIETRNMTIQCDSICKCSAKSESQGKAVIIIFDKENRKIDSVIFQSKLIPNPVCDGEVKGGNIVDFRTRIISNPIKESVTGKKNGIVNSDFFNWDELTLNPDDINYDSGRKIISFNVFFQNKDRESRLLYNEGSIFGQDLKLAMNLIKPGDVIYFEDIKVQIDSTVRKIPPVAFKIEE